MLVDALRRMLTFSQIPVPRRMRYVANADMQMLI